MSALLEIQKPLALEPKKLERERSLAAVGTHCLLELYDCPAQLLNDRSFIKEALREAARKAKSTLLSEISHQFVPQGVTALVLLGESHISIHTWPENGYAAIDVFTCGEHTEPETACQYLARKFQAKKQALLTLPRRRATGAVVVKMEDWEIAESSE